jgi:two-component system, LytTR family, sensor kinase
MLAQSELTRQALPRSTQIDLSVLALTLLFLFPVLVVLTYVSYRIGYDRKRWVRKLCAHILLGVLFGAFARPCIVASRAVVSDLSITESYSRMDGDTPGSSMRLWASAAVYDVMHYLILQGLIAGFTFYARFRQEQALRIHIGAQYDRARLNALRMQISPHFLYNTLSAIAGLIRTNPPAAESMVTRLGELFRRALAEREIEFVTLQQELEYAESYLEIQRMRFAERLTYGIRVEVGLDGVSIPPLLLQPLLENAVEHGLRASEGTVHIDLACKAVADRIDIVIRNRSDGVQVAPAVSRMSSGLGLRNVRERVAVAYHGEGSFEFHQLAQGEFEARISMPAPVRPVLQEAQVMT